MIIILVLVLAFNRRLRRPIATLKQLFMVKMYLVMEADYVKQEMAKSVPVGIWSSTVIASAPGRVRLGEHWKRSRKDGFFARMLATCRFKTPDGSVNCEEDVELRVGKIA